MFGVERKHQHQTSVVFPNKHRIVRELKRELVSPPCMSQEYSLRSLDFTCNICMSVLPIATFHNPLNHNFTNIGCVHEPACLPDA